MLSDSAKLRIICISDTHNQTPKLPPGDILIHAGDLTKQGTARELERQIEWLESQSSFKVRIVVAGNHDVALDENFCGDEDGARKAKKMFDRADQITYLCHEAQTLRIPISDGKEVSLNVFGSPYSRQNGKWAFGYQDSEANSLWEAVPDATDVLITHSPPLGLCDLAHGGSEDGCGELLKTLRRVRPRLHVCGHRHEGRGGRWLWWIAKNGMVGQSMVWTDPGASNKKLSLMDVTGRRQGLFSWSEGDSQRINARLDMARLADCEDGMHESKLSTSPEADSYGFNRTCVVNSAIMAKSYEAGVAKQFNKPIVVDINFQIR